MLGITEKSAPLWQSVQFAVEATGIWPLGNANAEKYWNDDPWHVTQSPSVGWPASNRVYVLGTAPGRAWKPMYCVVLSPVTVPGTKGYCDMDIHA